MAEKNFSVSTQNGSMVWNRKLSVRGSSGYRGQRCVTIHIVDSEIAQIQQKHPEVVNKTALESLILKALGIVRTFDTKPAVAVADTTTVDISAYTVPLSKAVTEARAKGKNVTAKQVHDKINTLVPEDLRMAVLKALCPVYYDEIHKQPVVNMDLGF